VNILRHLRPGCIRLHLETTPTQPPEEIDEDPPAVARRLARDKDAVIVELAGLIEASGVVVNPTKLRKDMAYRESQATTAVAPGIAIPHVRSLQVRQFVMGFARADPPGVPFASLDGGPTRFFFLMAAPPYDDRLYLQVYQAMAMLIQDETVMERLAAAERDQDVFNALRSHIR
jgi:fructose PTS system EIIBC or EIIC component